MPKVENFEILFKILLDFAKKKKTNSGSIIGILNVNEDI